MREYEYEPVPGLPEELPPGEHIVWQGQPEWLALANRVFHLRSLGIYFLLLIAVHGIYQVMDGRSPTSIAISLSWQVGISALALGLVAALAYLYARSTVYTFTNQRLVLKSGVAVPMMVNLPWANLEAAGLRQCTDGTGDILLRPHASQKLYRMMLWPHVRPWNWRSVQPLLRGVSEPQLAAARLAEAVSAVSNVKTHLEDQDQSSQAPIGGSFGHHDQHATAL